LKRTWTRIRGNVRGTTQQLIQLLLWKHPFANMRSYLMQIQAHINHLGRDPSSAPTRRICLGTLISELEKEHWGLFIRILHWDGGWNGGHSLNYPLNHPEDEAILSVEDITDDLAFE